MGILQDFINRTIVSPAATAVIGELEKKEVKTEPPVHASFVNAMNMVQGSFQKKQDGRVSFQSLRDFSVLYDVARACINVRKDQVSQLKWNIIPIDEEKAYSEQQRDELTAFFKKPAGNGRSFKDFVRIIVEDNLVIDGVALVKERTLDGTLHSLVPVEPETIRLRLDESGMLPEPPETAFEQVIQGEVVQTYTTDELIYEISNPRSNSPYGLSPLESLIINMQSSMKAQMYNLKFFTDGTTPPGFLTAPKGWSADQMKEWQEMFDAQMAGNLGRMNRIKMVPEGSQFTALDQKSEMFFKELEIMTLKKTCALFGVTPTQIGFTDDVNRATAQSQIDVSRSQSLRPMVNFLEEIFNTVIEQDFGYANLRFAFDTEREDEARMAETFQKLIPIGVVGVDEAREKMNLEPIGVGNYVLNATGLQFIDSETEDRQEESKKLEMEVDEEEEVAEKRDTVVWPYKEAKNELVLWKKRCLRDMKYGKNFKRDFVSDYIDPATKDAVTQELSVLQKASKEDITTIFNPYIDNSSEQIIEEVLNLRNKLDNALFNETAS